MVKTSKKIPEIAETRGRKPLPPGKLRKTILPVRVSPEEMAKLKELAESQGFTFTNYVRRTLFRTTEDKAAE